MGEVGRDNRKVWVISWSLPTIFDQLSCSEPPNLKAKPGEPQADLVAWLAQNSSQAIGNTSSDIFAISQPKFIWQFVENTACHSHLFLIPYRIWALQKFNQPHMTCKEGSSYWNRIGKRLKVGNDSSSCHNCPNDSYIFLLLGWGPPCQCFMQCSVLLSCCSDHGLVNEAVLRQCYWLLALLQNCCYLWQNVT